jgi:hypothetical protein
VVLIVGHHITAALHLHQAAGSAQVRLPARVDGKVNL